MKLHKAINEFIGTFFLVLTVCVAAVFGLAGPYAAIAIGMVLAFMIYAGGHISGAHYNPAVTLGACLRGKCCPCEGVAYIISQLLAAVAAVLVAKLLVPDYAEKMAKLAALAQGAAPSTLTSSLIAESLFTFALVWTVLNTATAKATSGNSFYGFAIGGIVMVGAFTVGGISGGVFNPAVATGLLVIGKLSMAKLFPYIGAQLGSGLVAAVAFKGLAGNQD